MASITCLLLQAMEKLPLSNYILVTQQKKKKVFKSLAFYIAMPSSDVCTPAHTAYNAQLTKCAHTHTGTHIHTWGHKWKCNHVNITLASSQLPGLIMAGLNRFISSLQKKELIFSCKYRYKALRRNIFPSSLVCIFFFPVHNYHQVLKILH